MGTGSGPGIALLGDDLGGLGGLLLSPLFVRPLIQDAPLDVLNDGTERREVLDAIDLH